MGKGALFFTGVVLTVCAVLPSAARSALILSVEPVPGQTVNGGVLLTLEVFLTNTGPDFFIQGIQVDFPCSLPGGISGEIVAGKACTTNADCPAGITCNTISGACNSASVGNASAAASGAIPWIFVPQGTCVGGTNQFAFCINNTTCRGNGICDTSAHAGGLRPIRQPDCRFGGTAGSGETEYRLPANTKWYVGTIRYAVSQCAGGTFQTGYEMASQPPTALDLTRIQPSTGQLAAFMAINPPIVVPVGRCCDQGECLGELNSVCCNALSGGDGIYTPGRTCANGCQCPHDLDSECNDGLFCTGQERCFLGTCLPGTNPCASMPSRPLCNEATDTCVQCFSIADCPKNDDPCRLATCGGGVCGMTNAPTGTPCDDGRFCTPVDRCQSGACQGSGNACPGQFCDEFEDRCYDCLADGDCDDENPCTDDACVEGICTNEPNSQPCDDGIPCTANDFCAAGACRSGPDHCPPRLICDRLEGACVPDPCPIGVMVDATPPAKSIDARQPHPVHDDSFAARQGIGGSMEPISITMSFQGASPECFSVCEAAPDPILGPNAIVDLYEAPQQTYVIYLARPITPGVDTAILYRGQTMVTYTSLPANANASAVVNANDVLSLIGYLTGESEPPYGRYSYDVNRSGEGDVGDIAVIVDLLNGAGQHQPWLGVVLAPPPDCP